MSRPPGARLDRDSQSTGGITLRFIRPVTGAVGQSPPEPPRRVLLPRVRIDATVHGFRSSFRDWCGEMGVPREVAEACLAPTTRNQAEAAYDRSDSWNDDAQSWRRGPSTAHNVHLTTEYGWWSDDLRADRPRSFRPRA